MQTQEEEKKSSHQREEGKRLKEGTAHSVAQDQHMKIGTDIKFEKNPSYIKDRIQYFEELYQIQQKKYAGKSNQCFTAQYRTTQIKDKDNPS